MPAKAKLLPAPNEWDFRPVPKVEVPIALVYECARSVDWICADWQVFLNARIPNWKIHRDKGGPVFVWGNKQTTIGATLTAGRFPKLRAHREMLWQFMCGFIPQRLSASWFVDVLKLLPQFPTPWLEIPTRLRTSIAKQYDFSGDDPSGFSVFAPGEPVAPRLNRLLLEDAYPLELARHASADSKNSKVAQDDSIFTVRINWKRNQARILRGFEKWLGAQFAQRGISIDRTKCGNASASHFTKLNWLGQMRLLDAVGYQQANAALAKRNQAIRTAPPDHHTLDAMGSQPNMSRNKKKISDLIKHWFPEPQPALKFSFGGYVPMLTK